MTVGTTVAPEDAPIAEHLDKCGLPAGIDQLRDEAIVGKATLDVLERDLNASLHTPAYYDLRPKVLEAHNNYLMALDLLHACIKRKNAERKEAARQGESDFTFAAESAEEIEATPDLSDITQPEFVEAEVVLRVHCEPWTKNSTLPVPSRDLCGVICRYETNCLGFALDPEYEWCLWYDPHDAVHSSPNPSGSPGLNVTKGHNESVGLGEEKPCSSRNATTYVKNLRHMPRNLSTNIWVAIESARKLGKDLLEAVHLAEQQADKANQTYAAWHGAQHVSEFPDKMRTFVSAKDNYTETVLKADKLRELWVNAKSAAYVATTAEALARPPFNADKAFNNEPTTTAPGAVSAPAQEPGLSRVPPRPLRWADFPNAHDTAWSEIHPDCPMGVPCFCDCRCRGPPPQNFVAPQLAPRPPCPPPPPMPNPFGYTLVNGPPTQAVAAV